MIDKCLSIKLDLLVHLEKLGGISKMKESQKDEKITKHKYKLGQKMLHRRVKVFIDGEIVIVAIQM
jgi:hypothetical protein